MAMNLHRWFTLVKALLLSRKNLPGFFRFREIRKKTKNPYFWLPQQKMGSMAELLLYLNSTHPIQ
jgi:hypothetical protein